MRFSFGECVFDSACRELTRQGTSVPAGPKLLRLLELLLDSRPRAVTKDEIHQSIWTGTFVSDATLTSLIADLRAAIGDDARAPHLIRTIHGYGYSFCGDVTLEAPPARDRRDLPWSYRLILADREITLTPGEHVLGRSTDAAVFVDGAGVSRYHARITIGDRGAILEDLRSKNGTVVNGRPVDAPMTLADGAVIELGVMTLRLRILEAAAPTDTIDRRT